MCSLTKELPAKSIIPFADVMDGVWPAKMLDWSRQNGIEFLRCCEPKNKEGFDLAFEKSGPLFMALEAKNHAKPIGNEDLLEILGKITAQGNPELLFVVACSFFASNDTLNIIPRLSEKTRLADYSWTRLVPGDSSNSYRLESLKQGSSKTIVLFSLENSGIVMA